MNINIDFVVMDCGSIVILTPKSQEAHDWLNENIDTENAQWWSGGVVIEHRYAGDIVSAITQENLEIGLEAARSVC